MTGYRHDDGRPMPPKGPPPHSHRPAVEKKGRKRIPRETKKRAALNRKVNPARKAFVESVDYCMVCHMAPAEDCHEIARGYAREAALELPRLWLAVCRHCHSEELSDPKKWPAARQIAKRIEYEIAATVHDHCWAMARIVVEHKDVMEYLR